ncbi:hypothetical protein NDR87_20050 [Nocardia sp. CDC159]|uniref:Uncharacterized protein n=1 Tax=Nocardia pulmonis TaxID=2951408 RepID=A0A9X2EDC6_9NOCA|nr:MULTISPECIES: hypothetical protein [Nocardia]MCM6776011.1 hypothetical protein [Nocardia pulmonis]MCM6788662.1 hypothetical protein [Nocardia sp. CDC159]
MGAVVRKFGAVAVAAVAIMTLASAYASADTGSGVPRADGQCVIDPADREKTVDSLRFHCTPEQAADLFLRAEPGPAPVGSQRFWVLPQVRVAGQPLDYALGRAWAAAEGQLGNGLTFVPGPGGTIVHKNYLLGSSPGGPLRLGISYGDGKPAWTIDFAGEMLGIPVSYHEFREIAPGVWLGWSYFLQQWNPDPARPVHGSYVITR